MSQENAAVPEAVEIAGRYVIVRKLGAGAFGTVYKAKDKVLGRMVAIKTIRLEGLAAAGASLDELLTRFMREAQVSAQLKHPNIVTIYDIGEVDGLSYLAMEFIDGVGLERIVKETGPLPFDRAASIAAQVAEALDYAHTQSVVHRDIKPANIMLEAGDRVKVTDFGIARVTNSADHLTATGSLLGTPAYMSPEQARGLELDGRSDLFSAGCVLYEMIAGKRAFRGDSITGLIFKVITEEPEPLTEHRPDCPAELVRIVAKAMSKTPDLRYQSGKEFAEALQTYVGAAATPTIRQAETPTEVVAALDSAGGVAPEPAVAPTHVLPATVARRGAPTVVAPPTRVASPPPPPVAPAGAKRAAAPQPPPQPARPALRTPAAAPRKGSSGLFVGLVAGAVVVVGALAVAGWALFSKKEPATDTTATSIASVPSTLASVAPPTSLAATTPETVPPATAPSTAPAPNVDPVRVDRSSSASRNEPVPTRPPGAGPGARAIDRPGPIDPRSSGVEPRPGPERPASDEYAHLDEVEPADDGGGGARRSGYAGVGGYRALSKVPRGLLPVERPAVATLMHIVTAEEAYHERNGRYATLQELAQSRNLRLDVSVANESFQRRGYRFRLVLENDGFQATATPLGGAGRPFGADDTGFVKPD